MLACGKVHVWYSDQYKLGLAECVPPPPPLSHSSYARQLVHFVMAPIKSNILHKPLSFTNPSPSLLNSFPSRKTELTKIFMSNLQRPLGRPCWYLTGDIWHWLPHRSAEMYGRWMRPDAFADPQEFSRSADWFGQLVRKNSRTQTDADPASKRHNFVKVLTVRKTSLSRCTI